jgi:uncharacterized protein YecT (DUF1311 family)
VGNWVVLLLLLAQSTTFRAIEWPLSYDGRSSNDFIGDNRARGLINSRVPAKLAHDVLEALTGPPDPVFIADHRYMAVSACVPHACFLKSFFWIDTRTGIGLAAQISKSFLIKEPSVLRLGSNGLSGRHIPDKAMEALIDWITENDLHPSSVEFIDQRGASIGLATERFKSRGKFEPRQGGPGFDCSRTSEPIDKVICEDPALSQLDLDLSKLTEELRRGHSTTVARGQLAELQRNWVRTRNDACSTASAVKACLVEQYRAQQDRLNHWIPSP